MSIKAKLKRSLKNHLFSIPAKLKRNNIQLPMEALDRIEASIRKNFHTGWRSEDKFTKEAYQEDLTDHLINRLENDRQRIIPWLAASFPLKGKNILEIGCGTGASTIALAEQGAIVTGVDLDEGAMLVAKDRAKEYNLQIEFEISNATEVHTKFAGKEFDCIIFFATLEHMTHQERMIAVKETWNMLKPGGFWIVIETPNRLWFFDGHTSYLPFFQWLPDDLAILYSKFSPRIEFANEFKLADEDKMLHFLRHGRGMSYHEFDLCMGNSMGLNVVSSKVKFEKYEWLKFPKIERQFKAFLKKAYPGLHDGFYDKSLDLIIKKQ